MRRRFHILFAVALAGCHPAHDPHIAPVAAANSDPADPYRRVSIRVINGNAPGYAATTRAADEPLTAYIFLYRPQKPDPTDPTAFVEGWETAAVYDPRSETTFIVPANYAFCARRGSDLVAFDVALGGDLIWLGSLFHAATRDPAAAVREFEANSDPHELNGRARNAARVLMTQAAPPGFFSANSEAENAQPGQPTFRAAELTGHTLRLDLLSPGGKFSGRFWVDLRTRKVTRAVVDARNVNPATRAGNHY